MHNRVISLKLENIACFESVKIDFSNGLNREELHREECNSKAYIFYSFNHFYD